MSGTSSALHRLTVALDAPPLEGVQLGNWRWVVRQRMAGVRDALANEAEQGTDTWLAARRGTMLRERNALLSRLAALGPAVLESHEVDLVKEELRRLVVDISHHCQRLHDLAYDEVELELGGSE